MALSTRLFYSGREITAATAGVVRTIRVCGKAGRAGCSERSGYGTGEPDLQLGYSKRHILGRWKPGLKAPFFRCLIVMCHKGNIPQSLGAVNAAARMESQIYNWGIKTGTSLDGGRKPMRNEELDMRNWGCKQNS